MNINIVQLKLKERLQLYEDIDAGEVLITQG
jgi:hypothetical protein